MHKNTGDSVEFVFENLSCPETREPLLLDEDNNRVVSASSSYRVINDVPVIIDCNEHYIDKTGETNATNPYSPKSLELINSNKGSWILDFGCGRSSDEEIFDNVIRMDFVHYDVCHVVSNTPNLPFKDNTFDHALSESVFEHVRDPWNYARELHRVLKPGGTIIIDTAFLQPVHGDPYHFYNMTLQAVRDTFNMFEEIEAGVEPYQSPGVMMNSMTNYLIDLVQDEGAKQELREKVGGIDYATQYDKYIPKENWHIMSAGVYFVGRKG